MTVPIRQHRTGRSARDAFSVRRTAFGFGSVALLICGGGFMVRTAWESMRQHPAAVVPVAALVAAGALLLHLRRTRRPRRSAAEPVAEAVHELFEAVPEPVAGPPRPRHDLDTTVVLEPDVLEPEALAPEALYEEPAPDYAVLDADAFEEAVAGLCERDGCTDVRVVGGAGDLGADVLATTPDGRRLVVQCKCYCPTNKVGSQDLQRFGGTCYAVHEAEIAVCVTTSEYTDPALDYAEQCGILCLDGEALTAWSEGTAPPPWQTAETL